MRSYCAFPCCAEIMFETLIPIAVIEREKMIMDFEKRRQTKPHEVAYKDFYSKLKD